jgi:2-polyprenyl-3-methyl-5-hydroxy-6-metoxy-1,4-benzoquinol methylase
MMTTQTFDSTRAEVFAEQMVNLLNSGAIAMMVSIGHRTRLFDTMAELPPASSQEIADVARLNERYVREWLNAMVVGRLVEYDDARKTYHLPAEHAAFLTRAASPNNIASTLQFIAVLGTVEDRIVDCFQQGGGVPYSEFSRFHEVMAEESGQTVMTALEDLILPLVPNLTEALVQGIDVLDVGCGQGRILNKLATLFPNSRFTGYDICEDTIIAANLEARRRRLTNIRFQVKDAARFDEVERYDLITTFDAIHDQPRPDLALHNIYNALRPDGVYLMQDIHAATEVSGNLAHPIAPFVYTISCMHCMTVSLSAGGMGLGTAWGQEKALQMLGEAGFARVDIKRLEHDIANDYYIVHKQ